MSDDDSSGMKTNLDGLVREQTDRRAMREQRGKEIKARAQEYMTKQVQTAQRYVEHRRELGQRKTKSGWSTDRSQAEPAPPPTFEEPAPLPGGDAPFAPAGPAHATPDAPRRARRPRPAEMDDEDDAFLNNRWRD
ncbi:hypothetical protein [Amycolatopsis nigrescens]|uniref:hypothetical protein n=1 Tax=Amycolatopsis nigrescens TaxID=381445 RepID=UPI0003A85B85|nr:hypothetical protein [Amycolatopsis nigrescens]